MKKLPFPLDQDKIHYFGYARTALLEGLRILGIKEGDNILIPAYICNVVLAPFNYLGIKVKYYNIDDNLIPNTQQIKDLLDEKTKGILAVNYFGFPQQIDGILDICRNSKISFIEDNAHGFLSKNSSTDLGTFGDISIFSFRKTLPIPNGAALVVNKKSNLNDCLYVPCNNPVIEDFKYSTKFIFTKINDLSSYFMPKFLRMLNKKAKIYKEESAEEEKNLAKYLIGYSNLSRLIMRHIDYEKFIIKKRKAYEVFLEMFLNSGEAEPIFKHLGEGVVPWVFPLKVKERELFIRNLYYNTGIKSFAWPALPEEVLSSQERFLSMYRNIVCLPLSSL
ncbi:MAG: aminotransferase class V-fold PLP-dependent enzyme [Candidatus Omnitrophica bacterium]|nr:aminotransferase class V-fold PLP-dependent enzyme [Candidatus Omnitrophota bacterium]MDD5352652.1 aminotransferase class V-fold PLP-dependent enzyme [Candidatus Omnitrophota bacterium]MDD5550251.1 aminotransferase class V-fold PLP-dependent enzyme [Candidatus Omnitrophota bacterium]